MPDDILFWTPGLKTKRLSLWKYVHLNSDKFNGKGESSMCHANIRAANELILDYFLENTTFYQLVV